MMKRREFITLLGGAAAAWPVPARAQQAERVRRIGILMGYAENDPAAQAQIDSFGQELHRLGWALGRNLQIIYRYGSDDPQRIRALAKELLSLSPDLVVKMSRAFMKRREFIALLGGAAAAWPLAAQAQRTAMPTVGFLRSTPSAPFADLLVAFRQGLKEIGFVEGQNVAIEERWADNQLDRLPGLAADLVRRQVAVIVANSIAAEAAKEATSTIPIVFTSGDDPVKSGLVTNLNRPGGNLTGVTFFGGGHLDTKRLELLRDLVPKANVIAVLLDPNYTRFVSDLPAVQAASQAIGRQLVLVKAASDREFDAAFVTIVQSGAGALLVSGSPFFTIQRRALVALAAQHVIPAIYDQKDFVSAGGLISYAASFTGAYHQAGVYAGRILKGAKPAELPVIQPTKFELVINLKTAKGLGLVVPNTLLVAADEVIE